MHFAYPLITIAQQVIIMCRKSLYLFGILMMLTTSTSVWGEDFPETRDMNVLFIVLEDCNVGVWGCYGNSLVQTPNVDRFAALGIRFDRAYCQSPSCGPSRASMLTGLRPQTTGVYENRHAMEEQLSPSTPTLHSMMKQHGLFVANIGKMYHSYGSESFKRSFDLAYKIDWTEYRLVRSREPSDWSGPTITFPRLPPSLQFPPEPPRGDPGWREWLHAFMDRYGDSGLRDEQHHDGQIARTAAAMLRFFSESNTRFFLSVGSDLPHTPLLCPKSYIDRYKPGAIPPPLAVTQQNSNDPYMVRRTGGNPDIFINSQPTPNQAREAVAAYYACISFMDTNIGLILRTLELTGLDESTIVVLTSDHGFHLGDRGLWSKYTLLEPATRVPLIVRVPGNPRNGSVCSSIVELVDLVPTLGELIGMNLPGNLEGLSFIPLLQNPTQPWKQAAFTSLGAKGEHVTIRTPHYRYVEWGNDVEYPVELYDLDRDPRETVNRAEDRAYTDARQEMTKILHAGWRRGMPDKR
jgi:arylsulfatase A-like enzyme